MIPPFIRSYLNGILDSAFKEGTEFLPLDMCPSKFLSISFQGYSPSSFELISESKTLGEVLILCKANLKVLRGLYEKDFIFERPSLSYHPSEGVFTLRINMLEKKLYNQFKEEIYKKSKK